MSPVRARPVPFCRHSFLPEPDTSPRCLVLWVPARSPARYAWTASKIRCSLYGYANTASGTSISRTCLLSKFLTAIFIDDSSGSAALRPLDRQITVLRTRHGAAHIQQVLLGVDLDDRQVLHRHPVAPHRAAGAHALEAARRVPRGADRARSAVEHRAVRRPAAAEPVALDDTLV